MSKKHALPEGVDDAVLNRQQLASAMGVSTNTIDRWMADGLPVLTEGKNGQAYEFQLSECWSWKQDRDEQAEQRTAEADRVVAQMRLALTGGGLGDSERSLAPKERRELYALEKEFNDAALARRQLIKTADVVELLESLFNVISDSVDALPDRLERECGLDGKQVSKAVEACDQMLGELRNRIEEAHLKDAPRSNGKANGRLAGVH